MLILFQTCKTFVHLQDTNEDICGEIWELFGPLLTLWCFNTWRDCKTNWAVKSSACFMWLPDRI